jgi:predicted glycoside hydrolase/deacetylase ChbG (UPF0249 family)
VQEIADHSPARPDADAATPSQPLRRIWLVADDYGISPAVNGAIRDLVTRRRLNATSVMVLTPTFSRSEAVSLAILNAGERLAQIGLHVTLTGPFRPLSAGFAPTRDGSFLPMPEMLRLAMLRRLDTAALAREIAAQLEAFRAAFGRAPDYVDGHHHVLLFPRIREAALAVIKGGAPQAWLRQCGSALPLSRRLTDPKGLLLDTLSRTLRRRANQLGIATNPAFAGTYAFTAGADFAALFPRFLDCLPDGGLIMCHPGLVDAELERLDPLTDLRAREYVFLGSDAFPAMLAAHGVALAVP